MSKSVQKEKAPMNWTATIMFIITTGVAVTLVPWYGITYGYETSAWVSYLVLTWITGMAITGGYHRLWSHNSYDAHPLLRVWYALWGGAALENTILDWCSGHRVHHRHCDDVEKDPYSAKRGLWFSHMGWMLREYPSGRVDFANVKNLMKDPIVMWQYKYYVPIVFAMNIGVPLALGLIFGDVWGMLLLAGFLRIVTTHHVTFFINSIALKLHLHHGTTDFEIRNSTQVAGQTNVRAAFDEPLGWVPVKPTDTVTVVCLEDVVVVVVTLTVRQECEECIVTRSVLVGVWLRAPFVRDRVDEEGHMVSRHDAQEAS